MMADLIDRQAALEEIASLQITINGLREGKTILQEALTAYRKAVLAEIEAAPAVDAVEVVRCKDCKWCVEQDELTRSGHCDCIHRDVFVESHDGFEAVSFDDFCSYGERREDDG